MSTSNPDIPNHEQPADPLYHTLRVATVWCQKLFAMNERGDYRWDRDDDETEIFISGTMPSHTGETNTRPIIVVGRTGSSDIPVSRDGREYDLAHANLPNGPSAYQDFSLGRYIDMDLTQFVLTFTVVSREGVEAGDLAWYLRRMWRVFSRDIAKLAYVHKFSRGIQVSAEAPHGSLVPGSPFPDWKAVQMSIPTYLQDQVMVDRTTNAYANLLKDITITLNGTE